MEHLDKIYDAAFFAEWGPGHVKYVQSAQIITDVIVDQFKPRRLIDLGCGCGVYSHFFSQKGVTVVAVDGVAPPGAQRYPVTIHTQDLTVPFENSWGAFDLTLCLEVAEHIPESDLDRFLANITRFSDRLLLSAAPPGQGGHHHVNEQPKRYWVSALARRGFLYNRKRTGEIFERLNAIKLPYMWMGAHISLYEKAPDPDRVRGDLPFSVRLNASSGSSFSRRRARAQSPSNSRAEPRT